MRIKHGHGLVLVLYSFSYSEDLALEVAAGAAPDLLAVVVAGGQAADLEAFCGVLARSPGAFAEAPVFVGFAGSALHHLRSGDCGIVDRGRGGAARGGGD